MDIRSITAAQNYTGARPATQVDPDHPGMAQGIRSSFQDFADDAETQRTGGTILDGRTSRPTRAGAGAGADRAGCRNGRDRPEQSRRSLSGNPADAGLSHAERRSVL